MFIIEYTNLEECSSYLGSKKFKLKENAVNFIKSIINNENFRINTIVEYKNTVFNVLDVVYKSDGTLELTKTAVIH